MRAAVSGLSPEQLWARPAGVAAIGFHLFHLAGATDRLVTAGLGEAISEAQRAEAAAEKTIEEARPALAALLERLDATIAASIDRLRAVDETALDAPRKLGRLELPTSARGLLFHAAEHAARHAGQVVTTARIVRGG